MKAVLALANSPYSIPNNLTAGDASWPPSTPPEAAHLEAHEGIRATSSRRRRLWELPHKCHCPIVGVCFATSELRRLLAKVIAIPRDASDFTLHTTAVGYCEERTGLAEVLHKTLEKRHQTTVRRLSALKSNTELRSVWQRTCREGVDIPATLWAIWTHPACDNRLEQEVYGDIHMIQHQLGSRTQADLQVLNRLETTKLALEQQLDHARQGHEELRQKHAITTLAQEGELAELRRQLASSQAREGRLQRQLLQLQQHLPELAKYDALARKAQVLEVALKQRQQEADEQQKELLRLRQFAQFAEEMLEAVAEEDDAAHQWQARNLNGKCVLCVGGRTGAISSYRDIVEQSGGKFMHHDGGQEESLHRIEGALAAADIVICQAGCISHNAYWRVKDSCKRTGKPCLFVKKSGVSSFGRAISEAGGLPSDGLP